ncbi:hypothetical protein FDH34_gp409 [Serratia phage BF]|uniref:Uncharacterized protein n=1 Tax=Serratia phage BF TaxID=1962671 RepID=A0A1S6UBC8_9CAUD|nr:hypothetical protein FDH34_gp409 [Serratia phage BF]AQW89036.1 hypothetical protein BF_0511 [Serratia phage BF]
MKIFIAFIVCVILIFSILITVIDHKPKITAYESQESTEQKKEDEDDCTYTMCNSFGGGIAGDTLAIGFMFGE